MRKLIAFNNTTLDGCFTDAKNDMSWAHDQSQDSDWNKFTEENAKSGGELVFGRVTYEMMAGWWPTSMALQMFPTVAQLMNSLPKVVFFANARQRLVEQYAAVQRQPR